MGKWCYRIKIDMVAVGQFVAGVTTSYANGFQRHEFNLRNFYTNFLCKDFYL